MRRKKKTPDKKHDFFFVTCIEQDKNKYEQLQLKNIC